MITGLVAGFGEPLGADLLWSLRARGIDAIVQDVQAQASADDVQRLRADLAAAEMHAIWIARLDQIEWFLPGEWVQLGNEPDLWPDAAQITYLGRLPAAFSQAHERGVICAAGAISNLNPRGFACLERLLPLIPPQAPVAVHRYPTWPGFAVAHPPARTRLEEVEHLRALIGPARAIWVTEVGYHTSIQPKPWWHFGLGPRRQWTDLQVAHFARQEDDLWCSSEGVEACCWYQYGDGPSAAADDCFGIRRVDGTWKPVSAVWADTAAQTHDPPAPPENRSVRRGVG